MLVFRIRILFFNIEPRASNDQSKMTMGAGSANKKALRWTHPDIAASTTSNSVGSNASSIDTAVERERKPAI